MGIRIECPYCGNEKANTILCRSPKFMNDGLVDYEVICGSCGKHFGLRTVRYAHPSPISEPKNTEEKIDVFTRGKLADTIRDDLIESCGYEEVEE